MMMFSFFILFGCKTQPINQIKNKQREGLWIEEYPLDTIKYKSVGKYYKGDPIKKWCYYQNSKIIKKEKYKKDICYTIFFNANGKIQSKGKTKLVTTSQETHWFYYSDWKFYNDKGKLVLIKKYENGELKSEIKIQ